MWTQFALFPGDSEIDELYKIFQVLGTPSEENWSGISSFPHYKNNFPIWKGGKLSDILKGMDEDGIDLIEKMLIYEPSKRISAKAALSHPYFDDLDKSCF
jgi:serine/threonine protein kinase